MFGAKKCIHSATDFKMEMNTSSRTITEVKYLELNQFSAG